MLQDPDNRTFEYLLVIDIPKGSFYNSVITLKKLIQKKYNCRKDKVHNPHLTLILTCLHESREHQFIRFLAEIAEYTKSFNIQPSSCKGYGSTPVVYVDVTDKKDVKELVKRLRVKLKGFLKPYQTFIPRFCSDSHITIAKDMDKAGYELALEELISGDYNFANFHAGQMILLKKRLGPYKKHKEVALFKFSGKTGSQYIQVSLFNN